MFRLLSRLFRRPKMGDIESEFVWANIQIEARQQIDQEFKPWELCTSEEDKNSWSFLWHIRCKEIYRAKHPFQPSS